MFSTRPAVLLGILTLACGSVTSGEPDAGADSGGDLTAPMVMISGPANPSTSVNATFMISTSEPASLECELDGGGFASCTSPVTYSSLGSNATHRLSVRATDRAGNVGTGIYQWAIQDPCVPLEIEAEDASQVARSAGWSVFFGAVLHNGEGLGTTSDNSTASVSFSFYGEGLTVFYESGPNRGDFTVSVDGTVLATIDGNAPDFVFQVPAIIATNLALGRTHDVILQCVANTGFCSPDYFGITCN